MRHSYSSRIPTQLQDGDLELGVFTYDPNDERLVSTVIYTDHLAFVYSAKHRFADRTSLSITELHMETFIAHNVLSPYREVVLREFQRHKVPLNMDVELPIRLVFPARRNLSHAAKAFLELVQKDA